MHEHIQQTRLDNGLTILTEQVPYVRSVAVGILIKTGSRYESENQAGITHFIEHMLFKGTKNRTAFELTHSIESRGGLINAATSNEYTTYYVRSLDKDIHSSIDVLSDMVLNPLFPKEELEKEKKVVLEEIKMYNDSPDDFAFEQFIAQIFKHHSLGRPILGFEETIHAFSQEALYEYMKSYYTPENMIISVAGNMEHHHVVDQLYSVFGQLKKGSDFPKTDVLPQYSPEKVELFKDIEQAHLILGRRGLSSSSEERFRFLLMNMILGVGFSSRLYQNIREKYGYCYSINTTNHSYYDTGFFAVMAGTDQEHAEEVKELVFKEFTNLATTLVDEQELDTAKAKLNGMLLMGQESLNNRMNRMAKSEMYYGRYIGLDEIETNINAVTKEQILEFCSEFLQPDYYSETLLLPSEIEE